MECQRPPITALGRPETVDVYDPDTQRKETRTKDGGRCPPTGPVYRYQWWIWKVNGQRSWPVPTNHLVSFSPLADVLDRRTSRSSFTPETSLTNKVSFPVRDKGDPTRDKGGPWSREKYDENNTLYFVCVFSRIDLSMLNYLLIVRLCWVSSLLYVGRNVLWWGGSVWVWVDMSTGGPSVVEDLRTQVVRERKKQ